MKQNRLRRTGALILTLAMLLSLGIIPAAAANEDSLAILKVEQTKELSVQLEEGENTVDWASNDPDVATVEQSKVDQTKATVTAVAIGTTTVTATITSPTPPDTGEGEGDGNEEGDGDGDGETTRDTPRVVKFNIIVTDVTALTLDRATMSLVAGRTGALTATVTPTTATVTWKSDNESVATVSNDGTVTAVTEGKATITAEAGGLTATCEVTVTPKVPIKNIVFTNTTSNSPGATVQFNRNDAQRRQIGITIDPETATYDPDDIIWTTSNTSVAKVEKDSSQASGRVGILTAAEPGETTLTVTIGEITSTCRVIVSGIRLSSSTLTMTEGKTDTISVGEDIFGEAKTTDLLKWSSSDPSVVTVNGGKLTARTPGKATITVEKGNYTATCQVTVVEDVSALIEAGSVNAGTPFSLNQSNIRTKLNEISIEKTKTETVPGSGLSYITNLNVSTVQGIVHNGYIYEGDTGAGVAAGDKFYLNPTNSSQADMTKLYFVPRTTFSGPAEISFTGVATNNEMFTGTIRVQVNAMDDVHYAASVDTPYHFEANDFNNVCRTRMGRDLNYVTFTLPNSSQGTLYYNYTGQTEYETRVTANTNYKRSGSPYLDQVCFVPAAGFTGDVTIDYRGIDTSGAAYNGKLYITVSDRSLNDAEGIVYDTEENTTVSFITRDFTTACSDAKNGTLDYIRFTTLPNSSQGTLRYDYRNSSNPGSAVTTAQTQDQRYYNIVSNNSTNRRIADLTFVPASGFTGRATMEFVGYNTKGETFHGTVTINVGVTTSSGRTIHYDVTSGRSVNFVAADFNETCQSATKKALSHIRFDDGPTSSQGKLYYNYSSSGRGTEVRTGTSYYYNSSPRISDLTFVPNSGYSGTVRLGFTGYTGTGSSDETFTGVVEISVGARTPSVTYFSTTNASTVRLSGTSISSACNSVLNDRLSYIQFTGLCASSAGHLYRNYSGFNTGTQVTTGTQYYVSGSPSIDQLTFVPRNTFQGVASFSYTGYSTSGEQVNGRIDITVTSGGVTSSFNDMNGYQWANSSVNYLASNGVVTGVGDNNFAPGLHIKRCDFVVMLCRAFGFTNSVGSSGFDDVPAGSYYSDAVNIAKNLGIVSGTGGNNFSPNGQLTRQDGMLMIRNALSVGGWSIGSNPANLDRFSDGDVVSSYARNAVSALVQLGAVNGDDQGRLRPHDPITRAEVSVVLHYIMTM